MIEGYSDLHGPPQKVPKRKKTVSEKDKEKETSSAAAASTRATASEAALTAAPSTPAISDAGSGVSKTLDSSNEYDEAMRKVAIAHMDVSRAAGKRNNSTKSLTTLRPMLFWSSADHGKGHAISGVGDAQNVPTHRLTDILACKD